MSYCRWSKHSDAYVIGTLDGKLECCGCGLLSRQFAEKYGSVYTATAAEMIAHLEEHVACGDKILHYAFERLRIDARREEMRAAGYVRQASRWQLPRQLGLTRIAKTSHIYRGPYPDDLDTYPADYHCVALPERWVRDWAERIADLPVPIDERRRALRLAAADQARRDALDAALATGYASNHLILDICTP
jgi:hypothetical protein